ncbi:uncharacterized protein HMPREF1541_07296 [Cyphellophora europaea CBS 101466]|uniref:Anaphase-promoting complex subunit 4-like WD40 domain-containing protein n=1 Tax=Cyphellophora europaea (strain CBS 101466) TaxID=1220924 RepID=W2RPN5_CYPE1|nr:uncharacterized protein HMPREF1541_07296 [Cyphellophora europaea CBS 101466]ETN37673.1 hypothetical protein HMPREF1541_07296 [Cyphellophora europaea CBS 101466]
MEAENPPMTSSKPPPLNSDQLNYLIWRYLQEAGYGDAAVKLQRDWNVDAENLPFARHIKVQSLVSLVQKGLRYHHLSLTIDENGRPSRELNPSMFFFGPESEKPAQEVREIAQRPSSSHRAPSPASLVPQKREPGPNGTSEGLLQPGPKRSRKTTTSAADRNGVPGRKPAPTSAGLVTNIELNAPNGHPGSINDARSPSATEPGPEDSTSIANGIQLGDRMDVDTDAENHSELPPETPVLHTLMNGESRAVQVEPAKVVNLVPSTTILGVHESASLCQSLWHPHDTSLLTAYSQSLCGAWRLSGIQQNFRPELQELVRYAAEDEMVTAIAWEPSGRTFAVALSTSAGGEIQLYDGQDLGLLETLSASQRLIFRLQWQETGSRLVGLAPVEDERQGSSILLWDLSNAVQHAGPHDVTVPEILEDIDCAMFENQGVVCASGGSAVYHCRAFSELEVEQKWTAKSTEGAEQWSFVKCAWQSLNDSLVVAASSDTGRIWLPAKDLIHEAHHGPITGLQIRPRPANGLHTLSTTEFATCSVDGTIKAWKYDESSNSLMTLCKLSLGPSQILKTLSYSPDGFCLAGGSYSDVRIWNAEHGYSQMATWQGQEPEWHGNALKDEDLVSNGGISSLNGDSGSQAYHSLAWDADSMKLAFSLGSQVAIINFQR